MSRPRPKKGRNKKSIKKVKSKNLSLNLYDLNKSIISQMKPLENLDKKIELINEF